MTFLFLICCYHLDAQVLFTENFDETDNSTSGLSNEGVPWVASCTTCENNEDYHKVENSTLQNWDSSGPALFETNVMPIDGCGIVNLSLDYVFSQPWEGSGNMETPDECNASECNISTPNNPLTDCTNCWDFLWVQIIGDGNVLSSEMIGEEGTKNDEQSGTISISTPNSNASNISIRIYSQTWSDKEGVYIDNLKLEYIPAPTSPIAEIQATVGGVVVPIVDNKIVVCSGSGPITLNSLGGFDASWDIPNDENPRDNPVTIPPFETFAGIYTLNVKNQGCTDSQEVELIISDTNPNAGDNSSLELCLNEPLSEQMLFHKLGGDPDSGGTWSPAVTATATSSQTYTYTVAGCGGTDTAEIELTVTNINTSPIKLASP